MMLEYKIAAGTSIRELEIAVQFWLDLGWSLQGGVGVGPYLYQALVKTKTEEV
jgi:hypothetical protein